MKTKQFLAAAMCGLFASAALAATPNESSVLPFPPATMESVVKPRLQDSKMKWPAPPQRLPKDAPNILIVLVDDVGFDVAETFGGEVHTPTLSKLPKEGLRYNAFHTTAICSPTRAAHGPHHIWPEWADKYKGKFDDGWDAYRERMRVQLSWMRRAQRYGEFMV
jgi:arylsulfatase